MTTKILQQIANYKIWINTVAARTHLSMRAEPSIVQVLLEQHENRSSVITFTNT